MSGPYIYTYTRVRTPPAIRAKLLITYIKTAYLGLNSIYSVGITQIRLYYKNGYQLSMVSFTSCFSSPIAATGDMTCATLYYYVMQAIHNPRNLDFIYTLLYILYYTAYWDGGWESKKASCLLTSWLRLAG